MNITHAKARVARGDGAVPEDLIFMTDRSPRAALEVTIGDAAGGMFEPQLVASVASEVLRSDYEQALRENLSSPQPCELARRAVERMQAVHEAITNGTAGQQGALAYGDLILMKDGLAIWTQAGDILLATYIGGKFVQISAEHRNDEGRITHCVGYGTAKRPPFHQKAFEMQETQTLILATDGLMDSLHHNSFEASIFLKRMMGLTTDPAGLRDALRHHLLRTGVADDTTFAVIRVEIEQPKEVEGTGELDVRRPRRRRFGGVFHWNGAAR